ncbi:phosphotransferase enzyme family protein [Colwellia hornerae]|uniref:Aminoglycoside phosphotransferase family protein n=1 Tax=Colwellia hornerae TaxID=89402 RepID=A0A5C6Q9H8_9GAMM|nr:aminoglycoside phosphotransferase family protein [Colwellia hornerae]TWX53071.1 aminoglycoside phosphotransferase family protein [Colwellia hornerae]TWX59334.1 aminoglycoside phosphotransferase family protein [Colwellia hornerae]TWX65458.1 aminoglycoside phosphotransferase family protein [Colwellia hornerae]
MSRVVDNDTLKQVLTHYRCSIDQCTVSPLGNGLINSTYLVSNIKTNFVLQRVNKHVFKNPQDVIDNADLINKHLLAKQQHSLYALSPIWQISTINQQPMVIDAQKEYWRAIQYIPDCFTVDKVETPEQARQVGSAFAQFTAALSDFPTTSLTETIADFHDLSKRMNDLRAVINTNAQQRLSSCQTLVDFCFAQQDFIDEVASLTLRLPLQVTHNDTKINNLLFCAKSNQPLAVIDLDTCMPGYLMHDFGDMVRTCCSTLAEDGEDLANMAVRFDIYSALAHGYIEAFGDKISALEQQSLTVGAQLLPFMIGVRFLTDYLDGDHYFHVKHQSHNLERAKNQLNLYHLLHKNREKLDKIITDCAITLN